MKKVLLGLLLVAGVVACKKEYHEHIYETPDINISIDNNQNLSNSNTNNANIDIIAQGGQSESNSFAENLANAQSHAFSVADVLIDQGTHGQEATGNDSEFVEVGFGFVSSEFGITATSNNSGKDNVIGNATYEHKLDDSTVLPFYVWPAGETRNASNTITVLITPQGLIAGSNEISLDLVAGNYQYEYDATIDLNTSATLPFEVHGAFRAYGQRIDEVKQITTDFSYFTINQINLAKTPVLIDGIPMQVEADVDLGEGDAYRGDYYYLYVRSGSAYDMTFYYDLDTDDPYVANSGDFSKVGSLTNRTIELAKYTHYNCIVNVFREDAESSVYAQATFPDYLFESKEINFYIGGIELQETFGIDATFFTDNNIPTLFGHDTSNGDIRWFRHEYGLENFIRPDGNTPMLSIEVVVDGAVVATFSNATGDAAGETEIVKQALAQLSGATYVAPNSAPVVTLTGPSEITAGEAFTLIANATDADGDTLTYSFIWVGRGEANNATISGNEITFPGVSAQVGRTGERVRVTVSDGTDSVTAEFVMNFVEPANETVTTTTGDTSSVDRKSGGSTGTATLSSGTSRVHTTSSGFSDVTSFFTGSRITSNLPQAYYRADIGGEFILIEVVSNGWGYIRYNSQGNTPISVSGNSLNIYEVNN